MLAAGRLRDRITIERATVTPDAHGEEQETWAPLTGAWAEVNYGRGEERRSAAQQGASLTALFRIRLNPTTRTVSPADRLSFAGGLWDISSAVPLGNFGLEITATRRTA